MLAQSELMELYRSLETEPTLSVYIDADQHDPAERGAWKTKLEGEVSRVRKELANGDGDAFDAAWGHVWDELKDHEDSFLPGAGVAAFATADRLVHVAKLPIAPPTQVRWEEGLRAAPYVRLLKQDRPVVVVLVDRERARLFTYRDAELVELESMVAEKDIGDVGEVGMNKRGSQASGRRGQTANEKAQRILAVEADRLQTAVAERVAELVGSNGFVVVGGTKETTAHLVDHLPKSLQSRAETQPSLHLEMNVNELGEAVRDVASRMTEEWQRELVDEIRDAAHSGGKGCLGRDETIRALQERRVDTLIVARAFVEQHPDLADRCVGTAFGQSAAVEEVGGVLGDTLMREADGLAARLRFRIRPNGDAAAPDAA